MTAATDKVFQTLLAEAGMQWHAMYKAVQAEEDAERNERLIYECSVLERKLNRLLDQKRQNSQIANNKPTNNNDG